MAANENVIIMAPNEPTIPKSDKPTFSMFLAGTIDLGKSEDWQKKVCDTVEKLQCRNARLVVFNPRRKEWSDDEGEMQKQIKWELNHMEKADMIIMFIAKGSKSPISLMELGIHAKEKKLVVFCSESFYRFENIEETCKFYNIPLVKTDTADTIIDMLKALEKDITTSTVLTKVKNLT